jgi:GH15 family glucan-1,4-alpha-glucosidase
MTESHPISSTPTNRRLPYAGIVGNGRTGALADARGCIGWLCVPTFAQFPVFANLLDPAHGGCLEVGLHWRGQAFWARDYGYCAQQYLPGTNVLETTWEITSCRVILRDAMPWGQDVFVREVIIEGSADAMIWVRVRPTAPTPPSTGFRVERDGIAIEETRCAAKGKLICRARESESAVVAQNADEVIYEFAPRQNRLTLSLEYHDARTDAPRPSIASIEACAQADAQWLESAVHLSIPDQQLQAAFERSLLALRVLPYEPTGAILAAPTASFPSEPGGHHNWDYRYCWVRDGCYIAQAFDLVGRAEEPARLYQFLLARETNGQWRSPLWAIESDYPTTEEQVAGLYGPGGETPIRIGNSAALQDQHDSPGNVISGVYQHVLLTGNTDLAARHWTNLARAAEWCCDHWADLEAGIWERRERNRAWVHGRALCWVALRDAICLARLLRVPVPPRWESTVAEIARTLPNDGWSEEKGAFVRACNEPSIYDISVLALVLEDLIAPDDPHLRRTVDALARAMAFGPAFRRDEEDVRYPFYLATFWMVRALQRVGESNRAYAHLRAVIEGASALDLMAEYFDPITSRQFGNFPEAYSHEELIRAVCAMLWHCDGERLTIFPALPSAWLSPGTVIRVSNIPLKGARAEIALVVEKAQVRCETLNTEGIQVIVPPRFARG